MGIAKKNKWWNVLMTLPDQRCDISFPPCFSNFRTSHSFSLKLISTIFSKIVKHFNSTKSKSYNSQISPLSRQLSCGSLSFPTKQTLWFLAMKTIQQPKQCLLLPIFKTKQNFIKAIKQDWKLLLYWYWNGYRHLPIVTIHSYFASFVWKN